MKNNLYSPHYRILPEQRRLRLSDLLTLFFSFGIGLAVMQTGTVLAIGAGSLSYASIFFGAFLGSALLGLVGSIGSRTGLSSMATLRLSFGTFGVVLPTILNILQLIGWGSFGIIIIRDSLLFLLKAYVTPGSFWLSVPLWSFIIGGLATLLAVSGPLSVVRLFLKRFAIWIVLAASIWLTFHLFSVWDMKTITHTPSKTLHWGSGIDIVVSLAFSYLPIIGDYTRFGKSDQGSFWGVLWGYGLASLWTLSMGASYTLLSPDNADVHTLIAHLALVGAGIPLFLLMVNEVDNLFPDIHSAAVSIALFWKRPKVPHICLLIGLICIGLSILVDLSTYVDFILAISSVFTPLFGIVVADFFMGKLVTPKDKEAKVYLGAVGSWIFGVVIFEICKNSALGGAIPSLLLTTAVRIAVNSLLRSKTTQS